MGYPWLDIARSLEGVSEISGSEDNPKIVEMFRLCGHAEILEDEVYWCAAFVGACLKLSGYKNTGSLMARSYEKFGKVIKKPVKGCIVVFWRKSKKSGSGHVGFYAGETSKGIQVFGGNQQDKVSVRNYSKARLLAYVVPQEPDNLPAHSILPNILDVNAQNAPLHLLGGKNQSKEKTMPADADTYSSQFLSIHPSIEKWEGGYVDHQSDPGGATNMGITLATLSRWRGRKVSKSEVRNLENSEARRIFKAWYYDKIRGDDLPGPVALATYNSGILSGPGRAARWLQQSINSLGGNLDVDGEIGPLTTSAAGKLNAETLASVYFDTYEQFLRRLKHWSVFGKGWLNRLNDMRSTAKLLPAPNLPQPPVDVPPVVDSGETSSDLIKIIRQLLSLITQRKLQDESGQLSGVSQPLTENAPANTADKNTLTPVNKALGSGIGNLLNGKKTGLGILGLLATQIMPVLAPELAGALEVSSSGGGTVWSSLFSALLAWGVLGKTEKWVKDK